MTDSVNGGRTDVPVFADEVGDIHVHLSAQFLELADEPQRTAAVSARDGASEVVSVTVYAPAHAGVHATVEGTNGEPADTTTMWDTLPGVDDPAARVAYRHVRVRAHADHTIPGGAVPAVVMALLAC